MKRFMTGLLAALLMVMPVCALETSARAAVLYDCLTGQVIWERNGEVPLGMASTTKIMTALTALELHDLDEVVTIRPEWTGIEGSSMYLRPGESLTVRQLLYGLMLMSGNDAAAALAGLHPDGAKGFTDHMNAVAQRLCLTDTHFENPSGLDGEHHRTTARDLARLADYALQQPEFAAIVGTKTAEIAGRYMKNHNRLLFELEGCIGVKTGYTKSCGRCLVSAAQRNGRRYIAVTLGDPKDWRDHTDLLEGAFAGLKPRDLLSAGLYCSMPVVNGDRPGVGLLIHEQFQLWLTDDELQRVVFRVEGPRFLYAPVSSGQHYGTLTLTLDGTVIHEQELYCAADVAALPEPRLREKIKIWWESR